MGLSRRSIAMAALASMSVLGAMAACEHSDDGKSRRTASASDGVGASRVDTNPTPKQPDGPPPVVVLEPPGGTPARVTVEVVQARRDIRRGLMYRQHMAEDHGMLFLMEREEQQRFWMKNTLIALDMIFITKDMVVAGIVENTVPMDQTSRSVDGKSLYVLEVNAGWSKRHGIAAEAVVRFENVKHESVRASRRSSRRR